MQSLIKASNTETLINNGNNGINVSIVTIADVDISDLVHLSSNVVHHENCNNLSIHENLYQDSVRNEMLTHYNRIVIGSFKEFFQSINMNNLTEVSAGTKGVNFMLANRAPELAAHNNMALEPHQIQQKFLTLLGLTLITTQLTIWSTVSEEDPAPEVINTIGTADSHLHY